MSLYPLTPRAGRGPSLTFGGPPKIAERRQLLPPPPRLIGLVPGLVEWHELLHGLPVVAARGRARLAESRLGRQEVRLGRGVAPLTRQAGPVPAFRPGGVVGQRRGGRGEEGPAFRQGGFGLVELPYQDESPTLIHQGRGNRRRVDPPSSGQGVTTESHRRFQLALIDPEPDLDPLRSEERRVGK